MVVAFDVEPSFDDFDYEVPFTASLINRTTSGLTYEWITTGGTLAAPSEANTSISIDTPGTYTITLKGDNQKENKTLSKDSAVKHNAHKPGIGVHVIFAEFSVFAVSKQKGFSFRDKIHSV